MDRSYGKSHNLNLYVIFPWVIKCHVGHTIIIISSFHTLYHGLVIHLGPVHILISKCKRYIYSFLIPLNPSFARLYDVTFHFWLFPVNIESSPAISPPRPTLCQWLIDRMCKKLYNSKMCKKKSLLAFASPPYPESNHSLSRPLHNIPAHDVIIVCQRPLSENWNDRPIVQKLVQFASPPYPLHHLPAHDVIIIGQRSSNRHLVLSRSHIIKFFKSHITPLLI